MYGVILNKYPIFIIWFFHPWYKHTLFISMSRACALRTYVNNYIILISWPTFFKRKKKFFFSSLPTANPLMFNTPKYHDKHVNSSSVWEGQRVWHLDIFEDIWNGYFNILGNSFLSFH